MGFFDFFKRQALPPTDLRKALIEAADRQDWQSLAVLCEQNQQEIRESFSAWQQIPEPVRNDPDAQNRYCQGLLAVAQSFEQAGDRSLVALLIGNEADNPIMTWEEDLVAAQSLIDDGRPTEAAESLQSVLAKIAGLKGTAVEHYLPRTCGMLGVAYFRAGDRLKAAEFTKKAKVLCEELGDEEGVAVYGRNLQHMEQNGTVIFRGGDGRELTLNELAGETGRIRYEIVGNVNVPAEAESLHKQARQAGGSGDYKEAISLLERAAKLAPDWPYPAYDMAFTYLLMKDYENAQRYYRKTIELAPRGFFTAITALDALGREEKGDLPAGTYLTYLSLEWMDDPAKKAEAVRQLVKRVPSFAPAWKALAFLTEDVAERVTAIENGLSANPDVETKGILQINKAMVLDGDGDHDGAVRLLGELANDPSSTYETEHMAKVTLELLAKK